MKDKNDIIQQIINRLQSHEEPYEQGAWEDFVAYEKKKKKKVFPLFWAAAACIVLLIGTSIFYYLNENKSSSHGNNIVLDNTSAAQQQNITAQSPVNNVTNNTTGSDNIVSGKTANATAVSAIPHREVYMYRVPFAYINRNRKIKNNFTALNGNTSFYSNIIKQDFYRPASADTVNKSRVAINNNATQNTAANNNAQSKPDSGKLTYFPNDVLTFDEDEKSANAPDRRWTVGAVLTPSMSNNSNKVNMGYGVALGYNVTKKISVNSGASYLQLTGYGDNNATGTSNIQANVTGISVPLELRYQISNKIYINAGASALAVLTNKQQRNYFAGTAVQSDAFTANTGITFKTSTAAIGAPVQKADAALPQSETGNQNVAGFFNFSIGMKQKMGRNSNFSVEPFISIPMNGSFGKQNIHLTNAGVRLRFGL